jgi:hypothetical protein
VRLIFGVLAASLAIAAPLGLDGVEFLIDTTNTPSAYLQNDPAVAFDGTNYLVVWEDWRSTRCEMYAARVTPAGDVLDPTGFAVSPGAEQQDDPAVAFDGTNFLVVWSDWRGGQRPNIYGARVTPGGAVLDPTGIAISTAADDQDQPAVCFDGTNWLVAWGDHRDGSQYDLFAARVTPAGVVLDTNGFVISSATRNQAKPAIAFDGSNTLVVWGDGRNIGSTANDIYAARVSPAGAILDPTGIAVSRAARSQWSPAAAFGDSVYLTAWQDDRVSGTYNIYAARITPDGGLLDPTGIAVCTAANTQNNPALVFDGTDFVAVWDDARRSGIGDIYGARVTLQGVVYDEQPLAVRTGSRQKPGLARGPGSQVLLVYQGYADTVGGRTYNQTRIWCKLDPLTAIAEGRTPDAWRPVLNASVVRGVLNVSLNAGVPGDAPGYAGSRPAVLLDATGRPVLSLRPGDNDVSGIVPGVYFVRPGAGDARTVSRVLLVR